MQDITTFHRIYRHNSPILLIGHNYGCGSSSTDGSFGPATDKAVRAYQKANGLVVDGSCGPATWRSLLGM